MVMLSLSLPPFRSATLYHHIHHDPLHVHYHHYRLTITNSTNPSISPHLCPSELRRMLELSRWDVKRSCRIGLECRLRILRCWLRVEGKDGEG